MADDSRDLIPLPDGEALAGFSEDDALFDALFADGTFEGLGSAPDEQGDEVVVGALSALGGVTATQALNERTLAAILATDDEPAAPTQAMAEADDESPVPTQVMAPIAVSRGSHGHREPASLLVRRRAATAPRRRQRRRVGTLAIIAAVVLALAGGLSYLVPTTFVRVNSEGASITLGVNLYGVTVSASANNSKAREILGDSEVRNMRYEDAVASVVEGIGRHAEGEDPQVSVEVTGGIIEPVRRGVEQGAARAVAEAPRRNAASEAQPRDSGDEGAGSGALPQEEANLGESALAGAERPSPTAQDVRRTTTSAQARPVTRADAPSTSGTERQEEPTRGDDSSAQQPSEQREAPEPDGQTPVGQDVPAEREDAAAEEPAPEGRPSGSQPTATAPEAMGEPEGRPEGEPRPAEPAPEPMGGPGAGTDGGVRPAEPQPQPQSQPQLAPGPSEAPGGQPEGGVGARPVESAPRPSAEAGGQMGDVPRR